MHTTQQERSVFAKGKALIFLTGTLLASGVCLAQEAASPSSLAGAAANTAAPEVTGNATANAATAAVAATADNPMTGHLLQTTLGLLFVLGLLFALVWLLKRFGVGNAQRRGGFYKVLATSTLGPREKIVLVEVGDTWLILGMTSNSINTLHSMPAGSIEIEPSQNAAASFAKLLDRVKTGKATS